MDYKQMSLFDYIDDPNGYKITKPVRLIELFAGYGSQAMALKKLGVPFEHYRVIEFDKYAIQSYNAVHKTNFQTTDITNITGDDLGVVDTDKYEYILTYSFPCQDLSLAGKKKGMDKKNNTRSGLLWEVERLLNEMNDLPQVLIMENVTQVHSKRNINAWNMWLSYLESKGYTNFWQDMNAKDYGIPQNRARTFVVSILNGSETCYRFEQPFKLKKTIEDFLEDNVDESFYLTDEQINRLNETTYISNKKSHRVNKKDGIVKYALCSRNYKDPKCVEE